jgi:hypothetical protein
MTRPAARFFRYVSAQTNSGTATGATGVTSPVVIGDRRNPFTIRLRRRLMDDIFFTGKWRLVYFDQMKSRLWSHFSSRSRIQRNTERFTRGLDPAVERVHALSTDG